MDNTIINKSNNKYIFIYIDPLYLNKECCFTVQWECHAHDDTGSALGSSSVDIHGDLYQNIEVGDNSGQQMMMNLLSMIESLVFLTNLTILIL